jgi:NADH:ubiquinone oxidoreductase subunit E/NAD-dependent dihydropyrimidine dehydrogenase PreA subunit
MWAVTGGLLGVAVFIGRPYCRWVCPYGAILGACSRVARKPVTVMPDECCDCELCNDACPYGAIESHAAVPATCFACAKCYKACPHELHRRGVPVPEPEIPQAPPAPAIVLPQRRPGRLRRIIAEADSIDLAYVDLLVEQFGRGREMALPMLQAVQERYRYLPQPALQRICERTELDMSQLLGVSTFYNQFRLAPVGEHLVCVCHGTACHVAGAERVTDAIRRRLDITQEDADTDADRKFTVTRIACLGCCSLAPCMQIDGVTYGHLTNESAVQAIDDVLAGRAPVAGAAPLAEAATCACGPAAVTKGDEA